MPENRKSTIFNYGIDQSSVPDDPYWLTISQQLPTDRATTADVATLVDALYDINPCIDTTISGITKTEELAIADPQTDAENAAMQSKLFQTAQAMGITACDLKESGDYEMEVFVIRSHPELSYTLKLSTIGSIAAALGSIPPVLGGLKIIKSVVKTQNVSVFVDVKKGTSVVLPFPVVSGLLVTWQGSPIPEPGVVPDTTIRALHNTLYWKDAVTGTIWATYQTMYDVVTISVPGVPTQADPTQGFPQDCLMLAFYHYQVYAGTINPPQKDTSVDSSVWNKACGDALTGVTVNKPKEPDKPKDEKPKTGCTDHDSGLSSKGLFKTLCCHESKGDPKDCSESRSKKPAGKLSEEDRKKWTAKAQGDIKFTAVPPCKSNGCGDVITSVFAMQHLCCAEKPPLVYDSGNSIQVIAPGEKGYIFVNGGYPPYYWKVRGQGFSLNGNIKREVSTDVPFVVLWAASFACGSALIEVSDNCTIATGAVRATAGQWLLVPNYIGCPATFSAASSCSGELRYEGVNGQYKVFQRGLNQWIRGDGNTSTFCDQCHTDPIYTGSCFSGWSNSCGLCARNIEVSGNCYIEPHFCTYDYYLGTYCVYQEKSVYKWRC